jgi:hypothetical protein
VVGPLVALLGSADTAAGSLAAKALALLATKGLSASCSSLSMW